MSGTIKREAGSTSGKQRTPGFVRIHYHDRNDLILREGFLNRGKRLFEKDLG